MENWTHVGFVKYARRSQGIILVLDFKNNIIEIPFNKWELGPLDVVLLVLDSDNRIIRLSRARDLTLSYLDLRKSTVTPNPPHFTKQEIDLLRLANVKFNESYIDDKLSKYELLLNKLSAYVDSSDIERIASTYLVKIATYLRNRAGEDDSMSVYFSSSGPDLEDNYLDIYLRKLLPEVRKEIYSETAFTPARRMLEEFMEDKVRWVKLEAEANEMTRNYRTNAIRAYSKSEHNDALNEFLKNRIREVLEEDDEDFQHSMFYYWIDHNHKLKNEICKFYGGTYQDYLDTPL